MRRIERRRFLWFLGVAGGVAACGGRPLVADDEQTAPEAEAGQPTTFSTLPPITRSGRALGSEVSLTVFHPNPTTAGAALDAAFVELELIESLLSVYRDTSQLSQLNREGRLEDPHPHLVEVCRAAQAMSRRTNGAFDTTIQPLWNLYERCRRKGRLPSDRQVEAARRHVNWQGVKVSTSSILLQGPGMSLTLNGIAQGFAADRVAAVLCEHDVQRALIDTGEISARRPKPKGDAWRVGIQHPRIKDAYVSLVDLCGRCLATSGDYATVFTGDYRQHHIFDPRTGQSPTELSSVTIAATSALQADALSTAVFVLGAEAGLKLVEAEPSCDALLVLKNGQALATDRFPIVS